MDSLWRLRREERQKIRQSGADARGFVEAVSRFAVDDDSTNRSNESCAKHDRAASELSTEQCIALIDYVAFDDDEISFRAGDVINVTRKGAASGFWEGYVVTPTSPVLATAEYSDADHIGSLSRFPAGPLPPPHTQRLRRRGLFPNCFVTSNMRFKSLSQYAFQNAALCLYAYEATGDGEMSFVAGDVITAVRPSSSPGWWYGVKSSGPAWVAPRTAKGSSSPAVTSTRFADPMAVTDSSASCAETEEQTTVSTAPQRTTSTPSGHGKDEERLFPTNFVTCDIVQANFTFTGRHPHELSFKAGDIIQVHRRWNDGWWEGSLRGRRGIFPSNYTIPNITTTALPLFCARCRTIFGSSVFRSTCATCAAEERVEDAMMQALEAYVRGEATELDLFAGVDIGLRTASEAYSDSDSDVGVDRASGQSSCKASHGKSRYWMRGFNDISASARCNGRISCQHQRRHGGGAPCEARVPLLTEKDIADLASNRVKLME
ncbi:hypothetical protein GH5_00979 [Leishmania sp. Ghana 2012 LV757]|uniref:hypothetical protein n=1 Tax=Leishmania sp. Ghana 2012 LV757 TaxID=2803181 RepID=UPI001B61E873|nr:hypothetical protein GH5_00979 [Leishmania sp. Ghana 2012 LV757]